MLEKEMFVKEIISQNIQIFYGWKFLFTQIQQSLNKEEIIEFENHHSIVSNKFSYVAHMQLLQFMLASFKGRLVGIIYTFPMEGHNTI